MCTATQRKRRRVHEYSIAVREEAIDLLEDEQLTYQATALRLQVATQTVWNWHQQYIAAGCELDRELAMR